MKFIIATAFILALAMGVQSSVIPWAHSHLAEVAGHGLSYTAVSSPVHAHILAQAPAAIGIHESPALHGGWLGGHAHGAIAVAGPGVLPHAHLGLGHGSVAVAGPGVLPHAHLGLGHGAVAVAGPAVLPHAHLGLGHGSVAVAGPAVLPHAHLGLGHEGQYLAQTRGAVHAAPLAGHIASAAAINIAPAPGTI